ncbi:hypothetical protein QO003_002941 [Arthrobacter silviterrae]|uniref:Lipoprotein n=1 Tax=Arthrobacter silviterrae TaxID=2026658 RepID=A0ABX0D8X4_9MICC|nr:hypothetical protein [Arthrobacter silviterrae]MDQ0278638.1 hypothetical protein [Arthrobacter silviterrae]NGN83332.1 hypothetical protein [Arthrobacter silviterrae]
MMEATCKPHQFGQGSRTRRAIGLLVIALALLTGCASQKLTPLDVSGVQRLTTAERFTLSPDGSYHGWWDGKPLPGQPTNLVIFSTGKGTVVQRIGAPATLSAKNWAVLRDGTWAGNVMLVLDPAQNRVMESFTVDASGRPTNGETIKTKIGGYIGWWNSTTEDGSDAGLPNETVQISTRTNTVVDGYNRATGSHAINYTVHPDPRWPKKSIIIVDTATNKVLDSFPVDENGMSLNKDMRGFPGYAAGAPPKK